MGLFDKSNSNKKGIFNGYGIGGKPKYTIKNGRVYEGYGIGGKPIKTIKDK